MKTLTFSAIYAQLRQKNLGQYALLTGCCFFSTLLITAYSMMMRAPTVLAALPEGGDSRKQVMMIFALTVVGCGMFTAYAGGLFFRYKSRECGIFMALGATKARLGRLLSRELLLLALAGCGTGMLLGGPLAFTVWQLFRTFLVDSAQMTLRFDVKAYSFSLAFAVYVLLMLILMMQRFLHRTGVLDVIKQSHTSELIKEIPRRHGMSGIVMVLAGALVGYLAPGWIITGLHWYPPEWLTAILYLPVFVGLYRILLHTVVYGWHRNKNRYAHLVSTGMMCFQGRQTVRNLLVVTVLIAGAYFAVFYVPIMGVGAFQAFAARKVDYAFYYRNDQNLPTRQEIETLAEETEVIITDYAACPGAVLAYDGMKYIETDGRLGTTYTTEYEELLGSCTFLSESAWNTLTGDTLDLAPGTAAAVFDDTGNSGGIMGKNISLVTNTQTGRALSVTAMEQPLCNTALFGRRVLDDGDYAMLSEGLPEDWRVTEVLFNVENVNETYGFARALFNEIVDRSGREVEVCDAWDPVNKAQADAAGVAYSYDRTVRGDYGWIDYSERDSSDFRLYWKYMPAFRVLDRTEFVKTMAVFLMLFLFIAILCFSAVFVILYTRCMTIAMNNASVYDDLRHLGASRSYLYRVVRGQISQAFFVPTLTGTSVISVFYGMILYFNDGAFSFGELSGALACAAIVALVSLLIYLFYRGTLAKVCHYLNV